MGKMVSPDAFKPFLEAFSPTKKKGAKGSGKSSKTPPIDYDQAEDLCAKAVRTAAASQELDIFRITHFKVMGKEGERTAQAMITVAAASAECIRNKSGENSIFFYTAHRGDMDA